MTETDTADPGPSDRLPRAARALDQPRAARALDQPRAARALDQPRAARALEWIRQLTHFRPRFAGTPSERAAAEAVGRWIGDLGFPDVQVKAVPGAPRPGLVIALHSGLALLALRGNGFLPAALACVTAWSFWSETRRRRRRLSRWLPASPSVNVIGRRGPEAAQQRVILSAHIDAAQAGFIFSKRLADLFAGRARGGDRDSPPFGPLLLPEMLVGLAAVVALAGWLGAHGFLFGLVSLALSAGLLLTTLLTLQWATAVPTPGANDNASAVAAMLTTAERLVAELPGEVEIWVVGTGAEEVGCCGMSGFVDAAAAWPRDNTWYINFECVGGGNLHYIRTEGLARKSIYPPTLVELARRLVATGNFGSVTPTDLMAGTDGHVSAERGYPTLSLISLEENGVPRNYHRTDDTVEGIDVDTVLRAADLAAEVGLAAVRGEAGPLVSKASGWQEPY